MPNTKQYCKLIRVAAFNVNSTVADHRRLEFLQLLREQNHEVIYLSETKLNNKHKITFKDYNLIRNDRPNSTQGGGTVILISKRIPLEEIHLPSTNPNEILEYCIIKVPISNQGL